MEMGQVTQVRATVDCLNSSGPDERKRPPYNYQQCTYHLKRDGNCFTRVGNCQANRL